MPGPDLNGEGVMGPLVMVEDPSDDRLADYRKLNDRVTRQRVEAEESMFVVEGRVAVARLLTSTYQVRSLLVDDHQAVAVPDLVSAVRERGAPVYVGGRQVVDGTVGFALHRGVVAVAHRPPVAEAQMVIAHAAGATNRPGRPPLLAVLEGLNDHQNIGALFRNAAAFGVAGVLLDPTCGDPLYRRAVRVSVGYSLHVPFARLTPWPDAFDDLRAAGFLVVALTPDRVGDPADGNKRITLSELARFLSTRARSSPPSTLLGVALVVGAEGAGLSEPARAAADHTVGIPMAPGVDSLNVATAAAIAFHTLADA
jgi:tRNA G18 (ribose-2'-O)-methylase SpoU